MTNRERVLERYPSAKALKLGRANWKIASGGMENTWLHAHGGNTAADAWARASAAIAAGANAA